MQQQHAVASARRRQALKMGLAVLCLASAALAGPAAAEDRNIYTASGEVRTSRPVAGDLFAAGGRIIVEHPVGGDAALAAGTVEVRAPVADDLRVMGGSITVDNKVGGDLVAAGADIALRPGAAVAGGADLSAANIVVEGRIDGALRARAERIRIDGEVRGPVSLEGEQIELGPKARILGALTYASAAGISRAEGAVVGGPLTREAGPLGRAGRPGPAAAEPGLESGGLVLMYVALLAFAAAFTLLMPRFTDGAAGELRRAPWAALGIGIASLVALPVATVLLFVTLLGIPVALALMAIYPVLLLAGFVVGAMALGRTASSALGKAPAAGPGGSRLGMLALALLVLVLLGLVPLAGPLFLSLLALAGLGAGVLHVRARRIAGGVKPPQPDAPPLPGHDVLHA